MSDVPSNLIPTRITGLPEYLGTSTLGYLPYVFEGNTYKVQFANIAAVGAVPSTREINTGSGLGGGGDLSTNRTLFILPGGVDDSRLTTTGVVAGLYGTADSVPTFTVNAQGRVTGVTNTPIVLSNYVPINRTITAGDGLTGGGNLSTDRTFAVNFSSTTPEPLGPGSPGVSTVAAREDHVHPAVDLSDTTETQGVLPLSRGGTGNSLSPVVGAVAYSSNDKLYLTPTAGGAGQVLTSDGGVGAPYWSTVTGAGTVTSVNLTAGTGISVSGGPITTAGAITVVNTAPDQIVSLTAGTNVTVTGTYPNFTIAASGGGGGSGTVTSVDASGGTTGLSFTGGPITTSGTLTLGGTLGVANGGTGATTLTSGYLVKGNGTAAASASVVYDNGTNVGIGTSSPTQKFTVAVADGSQAAQLRAATGYLRFRPYASGTDGAFIDATNAAENAYTPLSLAGSSIRLTTNNGLAATIDASGNVGIGTTSTLSKLTVQQAADGYDQGVSLSRVGADRGTIFLNATGNTMNFGRGSATNMTIDTSGNVGIGTTTPVYKLDVNGAIGIPSGFSGGHYNMAYAPDAASRSWRIVNDLNAYGDFSISQSTTQTGSTYASRLYVDTTGNVGIGTSSPSSKLQVSGSSTSPIAISINNNDPGLSAGSKLSLAYNGSETGYVLSRFDGGDFNNIYQANRGHLFLTGATERMRIDASGNVGIGTTSPDSKFQVVASGLANVRIGYSGTSTNYYDADLQIFRNIAGAERMRIDTLGNVGIGTSTPSYKFHVSAPAGAQNIFIAGQTGVSNGYTIVSDGTNLTHQWYNGGGEAMRIDTGGNVGVGTSTPLSTTQAAGSITANGFLGVKSYLSSHQTDVGVIEYNGGKMTLRPYGPTAGTGYLAFNTGGGGGSADTERFRITSTGAITSSDLADAVGYKGVPQNAQTSAYTLALSDIGKHISITTGGVAIPANGTVAFPIGATIVIFNNSASNQTISITTDTLRQAGTANTGSRTLAQYGLATCVKVAATTWVISGAGVS